MSEFMQLEENKLFYQRFIQEVFNEGRLDKVAEFVSPSYLLHDAPPGTPSGPEAIVQAVSMFRGGFPDMEITMEKMLAEGDMLAMKSSWTGTHRGTIFGIPATGRSVKVSALTMVRISKGRICESWVKNDVMGLMNQLKCE